MGKAEYMFVIRNPNGIPNTIPKTAKGHPKKATTCQKRTSIRREKGYAVFSEIINGKSNQLRRAFAVICIHKQKVLFENRLTIE